MKQVTVLMGIATVAVLYFLREPAAEALFRLAGWVETLGWMAPVAFVCGFAVAVPLLAPAAPFLLAAGVLFGAVGGTLVGFLGCLIGGALSFGLGRYLLRGRLERRLRSHEGFSALRKAIRREGTRAAALIRFSPALPAWLINYSLGISRITWRQYLQSSLAALPTIILYSLAGAGLGDLAALERGEALERGIGYYTLLAAGLVATIAATVLLGRRAREILEQEQ